MCTGEDVRRDRKVERTDSKKRSEMIHLDQPNLLGVDQEGTANCGSLEQLDTEEPMDHPVL